MRMGQPMFFSGAMFEDIQDFRYELYSRGIAKLIT